MKEQFIQFLWKNSLYDQKILKTHIGEDLEIIDAGLQNFDAGPDFFNAKIRIGNTVWVGNVEIHLKSDDWNAHQHTTDKAYNNVILHVVTRYTTPAFCENGREIPTFILNPAPKSEQIYTQLTNETQNCKCTLDTNEFLLFQFLQRLTIERLEERCKTIEQWGLELKNDFKEILYRLVVKSMGQAKNSLPFEILSKSVSYHTIVKQSNNLAQIEALLFGQAGFLNELLNEDEYYSNLAKEYRHLANKYDLKPMGKEMWKFAKLRPASFPTVRIAQLAAIFYSNPNLLEDIMQISDANALLELLKHEPSAYWQTHYNFNHISQVKYKNMGQTTAESILINAIIPFLFYLSKHQNNRSLSDKALKMLEDLKPETNTIVTRWKNMGVICSNAFDTQAILHLTTRYCERKECLRCYIGQNYMLKTFRQM